VANAFPSVLIEWTYFHKILEIAKAAADDSRLLGCARVILFDADAAGRAAIAGSSSASPSAENPSAC